MSTNIDTAGGVDPSWNGAGWVEVDYGISGNVASFTVHGQCHDNAPAQCTDSTGTLESRIEHFRETCACAQEQHYRYRWDELNRLVEGIRYDRDAGGDWTYGARLRYRYDGANQRTVKQSYAASDVNVVERHALYVYPGDFERRGLTIGFGNVGPTYLAVAGTADATETQYLIAGARIVWDGEPSITGPGIDRNRRATVNASDLLGTTAASLDLESGALLEVSTYYPNGARENLWTNDADVPLEPMGFTGKEADEEIGVTYFGERWLIPRLGRWATPDPLHVHAAGGGEALNSYHYVGGNLLEARDPNGLSVSHWADVRVEGTIPIGDSSAPASIEGLRPGQLFVLDPQQGRSSADGTTRAPAQLTNEAVLAYGREHGLPVFQWTPGYGSLLNDWVRANRPGMLEQGQELLGALTGSAVGPRGSTGVVGGFCEDCNLDPDLADPLGVLTSVYLIFAMATEADFPSFDDIVETVEGLLGAWSRARSVAGRFGSVVTGGDSEALGRAMRQAGNVPVGTGPQQPHHLIPGELAGESLVQRAGMQLDHASNGIWLPEDAEEAAARGIASHSGYHSAYSAAVRRVLREQFNPSMTPAQAQAVIDQIQQNATIGVAAIGDLYRETDRWYDFLRQGL
jgi:RHS repeat-associated protein